MRDCCNGFFLEVVSRFCLSEGQRPAEGVVELLFSVLIFANGLRRAKIQMLTVRRRRLTVFMGFV